MDNSSNDPVDDLKAAFGGTAAAPSADPVDDLKSAFASPAPKNTENIPHITIGGPKSSPKPPDDTMGSIAKRLISPLVTAAATYDPKAVGAGLETGVEDVPASLARLPGISDTGAALAHGVADVQGQPFTSTRDQDQQAIAEGNNLRNNIFNQQYGNNPWAQGGRIAGEAAATAPIMTAGGEALAPIAEGEGPAGAAARFVTGKTSGLLGAPTSKAVAGAAQGAGLTALTNASSNDTMGEQASRNMKVGAGLNTLVPALTGTAGWAINKLRSLTEGAGTQADNLLLQSLRRDGYATPADAAAKLQSMGPDATIGDLGQNTRGLMRTVAGTPSSGKNEVADFVENRQTGTDEGGDFGQSGRLLQAANKGLGVTTSDPQAAVEQLQALRSDKAAPLYKSAFTANQAVESPVIDKILNTDFGKSALQGAKDRMNTKMARLAVPDPELTEQARDAGLIVPGGVAKGLKLQTLDLVKQDMDDQINATIKKVAKGDMREGELNDMKDLRKSFVNELDANDVTAKAGPNSLKADGGDYAKARAAYAGPSRSLEAVQMGQDFIKNPTSVNAAQLAKMSDADKAFARQGVASALHDTLMNTPDGADSIKKIMGNPAKRKQLATFFETPEAFNEFKQKVENEAEKFKTYKAVTPGASSPTTEKLMEQHDASLNPGDVLDIAGNTLTGNHVGTVAKIAGKIFNKPQGMSPEVANKLVPSMLPGPGQSEAFDRLNSASFTQARSAARNRAINAFAGSYGIPAAVLGVNRLRDITGTK